jgi:hypothetical protein
VEGLVVPAPADTPAVDVHVPAPAWMEWLNRGWEALKDGADVGGDSESSTRHVDPLMGITSLVALFLGLKRETGGHTLIIERKEGSWNLMKLYRIQYCNPLVLNSTIGSKRNPFSQPWSSQHPPRSIGRSVGRSGLGSRALPSRGSRLTVSCHHDRATPLVRLRIRRAGDGGVFFCRAPVAAAAGTSSETQESMRASLARYDGSLL